MVHVYLCNDCWAPWLTVLLWRQHIRQVQSFCLKYFIWQWIIHMPYILPTKGINTTHTLTHTHTVTHTNASYHVRKVYAQTLANKLTINQLFKSNNERETRRLLLPSEYWTIDWLRWRPHTYAHNRRHPCGVVSSGKSIKLSIKANFFFCKNIYFVWNYRKGDGSAKRLLVNGRICITYWTGCYALWEQFFMQIFG